jgi:predicted enzyme related to lactoylglutathione lyase
MPDRDEYMPGVPCWIDTTQPDPAAAVEFYGGLFGWELEDMMPPGAEGQYFIARLRGRDVAAVSSVPPGAPAMASWNTYVCVASADETAARATQAGGRAISEPFDVMDAGRMAILADPEGAVFSLWEPRRRVGAQIVNEHGTVNFNGVNTRDPERARAFYREVFGWEVLDAGGGGGMWTLPGYADFLERSDPGLRRRMAESGAPEGFADVVATMVPLGEDQAEVPAHWSVTFGVDDADEIARRAGELGGEVVVPPTDAPWVRMTVLRDPQGASFIASQFVPENSDL